MATLVYHQAGSQAEKMTKGGMVYWKRSRQPWAEFVRVTMAFFRKKMVVKITI